MAGLSKHLLMVVRGQVRPQQCERRERDRALGEEIEPDGELAREAGRFNPAISCVLRQPKHLSTVREERRAALAKIESPSIELGQEPDESRGCPVLARGRGLELVNERQIG